MTTPTKECFGLCDGMGLGLGWGGIAGGWGEFTAFERRNGTPQMELAVYTITIATQWGIVGH